MKPSDVEQRRDSMFEETLKRVVAAVLGKPERQEPVQQALVSAERRLGIELPHLLRTFYGVVGSFPEVMEGHDRFVPADSLQVENDGLVFCHENQNTMFWAVSAKDLREPDPPVVQGQPGEDVWYDECDKLSVFLLNALCWQLVNALPSRGTAEMADDTSRLLRRRMTVVSATVAYNMAALVGFDEGLVASVHQDARKLYLAAREDATLESFERDTGIELDWL